MHQFDRDISLKEEDSNQYSGTMTDNWSINGIPNGGYLLASLANAMLQESDKKATPTISASYLSRCNAGEANFMVEKIAQSKQFNRMQARLVRNGEEKIRAMGTFAIETNECFVEQYEQKAPNVPEPDNCIQIPEMPGYTLFEHMDVRLDPECAGWMEGRLVEKSEHRGWVRFKDSRPYDLLSIILITDSFPPPVMATQGMVAWVPTLELSVNIRNMPESEWLKCIFRTRFITCGLLEEDGEVWDETGQLIAISRQIAQFRKIAQ